MGKTVFDMVKGQFKNVLSFSVFLPLKITKEHILFQVRLLKMLNKIFCVLILGLPGYISYFCKIVWFKKTVNFVSNNFLNATVLVQIMYNV